MRKWPTIIITLLIISIHFSEGVKGDIAPDPNYLTSLTALGETLESFLDIVNVTMFVEEKIADGKGSFKITNPSNEWENFSVVFDPGADTFDVKISIDDQEPFFEIIWYENFYGERWSVKGIQFNVSIQPNSSIMANLTWKYHVDQDSHKQLYYHTNRLVEYLIIGMMGWSKPITQIDVKFVMETDAYHKEISKTSGISISENDEGRKVYHFHAEDFSDDKLLLEVVFKNEDDFNPTGIIYLNCFIWLLFFSGIGGIIYLIHRSNVKSKNRRNQEKKK